MGGKVCYKVCKLQDYKRVSTIAKGKYKKIYEKGKEVNYNYYLSKILQSDSEVQMEQ